MSGKGLACGSVASAILLGMTAVDLRAEVVITEIMYSPSQAQVSWEWVELYNSGPAAVDLAGWVLDDDDSQALAEPNISGGTIPAGGTAVIFNDAANSAANFEEAWGGGINLVAASSWRTLSDVGDTIGLWDSYDHYQNQGVVDFRAAVDQLGYAVEPPWPIPNTASSIYLKDLNSDNRQGANWALSVEGSNGAWRSNAAGGNPGTDVGSPGIVAPEPALAGVALPLLLLARFRR